ncbi:glutaredoxin domain-containing protein [Aquimarina sp. 2201CG1-2-11]|uniref:glutaredoxin family protein n=1 Tax=Aquimarina discodermiae TaxID=3231043 RepID=UPI00346312EE
MICFLKRILWVLFLIPISIYSQVKNVYLVEEKQKKRTIIYVQNDSSTDKSVFLKINPTGYRRSAHRPIIKNIPANSKVQMSILIPLADTESSYTYNLIVNNELETIDVERDKTPQKEAPLSSIMGSEIIIFTRETCNKCETLISQLNKNHIKYREVNIDTRTRYREFLWELLHKEGYDKKNVAVPLGIVKGIINLPIDDIDLFVQKLQL